MKITFTFIVADYEYTHRTRIETEDSDKTSSLTPNEF